MPPLARRHGHPPLNARALATNLSFVLHERSDSRAVDHVQRACRRHAALVADLPPAVAVPSAVEGALDPHIQAWLSVLLGVPQLFLNALRSCGASGPHLLTRLDAHD